jgi:hypothetical protein
MRSLTFRPLSLLLSGLVCAGLPTLLLAQGQPDTTQPNNMFRSPPPQASNLPAARTQAVLQSTAPANAGYMSSVPYTAPNNPFNPYGYGYGYGYYPGAVGGYLQGAASVISSQGQFAINQQQAILVREDIKSARIANKQKAMEQYLWERQNMPTLQDDRERDQALDARRAKTQPPPTEVWSGKSLNDILAEITKTENANGVRGPSVPLDDAVLQHINLTTGATQGSLSMIRDGRLSWPALLRRPQFDGDRTKIDQVLGDLAKQAGAGALDSGSLDTVIQATSNLRQALKASVAELPSDDYIRTVRYLNQLEETWKTLQQPGSSKLLAGGRSGLQAGTVGDLVEQMNRQGVRFGPAAQGDEGAYNALYQALLAYDIGLTRLAAR